MAPHVRGRSTFFEKDSEILRKWMLDVATEPIEPSQSEKINMYSYTNWESQKFDANGSMVFELTAGKLIIKETANLLRYEAFLSTSK